VQQRLVQDLMRIRHGHVVPETATLRQVAERLIISDCDMMAVTAIDGQFCGVVCESSVVRALMSNPAANATIQSIVCRHAESVRFDACLSTVLPLFRSSANTAIPVVDPQGAVCGLLMRRDVIGNLLNRQSDANMSTSAATTSPTPVDAKPIASQIRPPFQKSFTNRITHSAETIRPEAKPSQKPHFLSGDAARRVLWEAEDRL
jgi:predicted transcriptional regulator